MDNLPIETFQLICSYCSLHALANLRLVSKPFRDIVDGSLTARRLHSTPKNTILPKGNHDRSACYVRIVLRRTGEPITVVFNSYSRQFNYLEFVQKSGPSKLEGTIETNPANPYPNKTLGSLDLNIWEEQREESIKKAHTSPPPAPTETRDIYSSGPSTGRSGRRSSITQAGIIRGIEHQAGQELASNGPITPLANTGSTRNVLTSAFGTSTSVNLTSNGPQTPVTQEGDNYMMRFARMVLGSTGTGPQSGLTRSGMTAAELAQQAQLDFHAVEKEVLSSKKAYTFILTPGIHYIGDNDFVMQYTISSGPQKQIMFQVDYIRASWKWVASGVPVVLKSKISEDSQDAINNLTVMDPSPQNRFGRIYSQRYNRLLEEIKEQDASHYVRGELALDGYDVSVLDRNFFSVNLYSEQVVAWLTRPDSNRKRFYQEPTSSSDKTGEQQDESSDSEWEEVTPYGKKNKGSSPSKEELEDEEALKELVRSIKYNMGFLTVRNILEGMLVKRGFTKDLIWKYGIVKEKLAGPLIPLKDINQLIDKILSNENQLLAK